MAVQRMEKSAAPGFCTPDMYEGAFLLARGHRMVNVAPINGRFAFEFELSGNLDGDRTEFRNNGMVGVRDLIGCIFALKRAMREAERGGL